MVTSAAIGNGGLLYVEGGDGKKYMIESNNNDEPEWYLNFGGTVYFTALEYKSTDGIAVSSKEAKVKIAAQSKAPKASLKLDATKAFTWKISNKQEFMIEVNGEKSKWADGSNAADSWATIIGKTKTDSYDQTAIVSGDAITADINISLRTKADKKAASAINLIKLAKSADSPTKSAVEVKPSKVVMNGTRVKTATGASIKAVADIQYSLDDGAKWSKLTAGKEAKLKDLSKTVLVRIPGESKKGTVLPSLNTKIKVDAQTGVATVSSLKYGSDGKTIEAATETVDPS